LCAGFARKLRSHVVSVVKIRVDTSFVTYEARTLLGLGMSRCPTRVVSDTPTPTLIITLNYVIFSNY